jgi:hypothetical protein
MFKAIKLSFGVDILVFLATFFKNWAKFIQISGHIVRSVGDEEKRFMTCIQDEVNEALIEQVFNPVPINCCWVPLQSEE